MMERRQLVLGGALAATLVATAWVATRPEEDLTATVAAPARRPIVAASAVPASAPATGGRAAWAEASASQLAAWQPPPPPPPPPAPPLLAAATPPPPVAPPAPYQMIGRVVEGEGSQAVEVALLAGPNKSLSARRGDVIDGQWRVEQVSGSGVRLTWLPSQLPQNIVFRPVP
ncbi:hypothetical protein [Roseateles sp.]|uniref:hypothetical protein n=1 Tax=Roseateles sp. TaxID=1971397 RepID=UPI0039E72C72